MTSGQAVPTPICLLRELCANGTVTPVRCRLAKWMVVAALVLTVGGHWGILQAFAWVGMAINFAQTDSVSTALVKTFNGKNPCKFCKLVSEGQKTQSQSKSQLELKKVELISLVSVSYYFPLAQQRSLSPQFVLIPRTETPPTPPPLFA